jgi:phage terminase Nu1 subunit (DNA packaging protein)
MQYEMPLLIDTKEVARITGMSIRWVIKWRHKIISARREGGVWRFEEAKIKCRIASNRSIID